MQVTSTQLNINTKRDNSGELSRFFCFREMKLLRVFLLSLVFVCIGSKVFANSLVVNYSNNKRLYKLNSNTILVYSTNKKLIKIDGLIPIPILIVLVTGLL